MLIVRCVSFELISTLSTYMMRCSSCTRGINRRVHPIYRKCIINQGCFGVHTEGESSAEYGVITSRSRERKRISTNVQMKLDERETEAEREAAFERELERDAAAWANGSAGRQKLWDRVQKWRKFNKREIVYKYGGNYTGFGCLQEVLHQSLALSHFPAILDISTWCLSTSVTECVKGLS